MRYCIPVYCKYKLIKATMKLENICNIMILKTQHVMFLTGFREKLLHNKSQNIVVSVTAALIWPRFLTKVLRVPTYFQPQK